MMNIKTLISKTAIDAELTRVPNSMLRGDRETIPEGYRAVFEKVSIRWGLIFIYSIICRRPNRHPERPEKTDTGYIAKIHQNDIGSENILVAGLEAKHRKQGQGLHRMFSIR